MAWLKRTAGWCVFAAALFSAACGNTRRNPGGPPTNVGGSGGGGGSGAAGLSGGGSAPLDELEPQPSELHRLNNTEYLATVEDVLGAHPENSFLPDDSWGGFDNEAAMLVLRPEQYQRFLSAAEQAAEQVFADPPLKARVVTCTTQDAECVRNVITGVGLRLFRRPLLEAEVPVYEKVYADARLRDEAHDGALQQVLIALLSSAQFLYRMEFVDERQGVVPLGPYELASRLSYLLWSSAPDDVLLASANEDKLSSDAQLEAHIERMWDDARSSRFVTSFAGQWLRARRVPTHATSPEVFPDWSPDVAAAAETEVYRYFDELLREEHEWPSLLDSPVHFVNGALAKLYGADYLSNDIGRISLEKDGRSGYLGLVAFLATTSLDRRTSPTLRGSAILTNLLCKAPPLPPADIPIIEPDDGSESLTLREQVLKISETATCASCHLKMDPLGLALENFDGIGKFRTQYPDGAPVDATIALEDGTVVTGLQDVSRWLQAQPELATCAVLKIYSYGMSRRLDERDERNIAALAEDWQAGPLTIKEAIRQLVLAKPFRYRSDGGRP